MLALKCDTICALSFWSLKLLGSCGLTETNDVAEKNSSFKIRCIFSWSYWCVIIQFHLLYTFTVFHTFIQWRITCSEDSKSCSHSSHLGQLMMHLLAITARWDLKVLSRMHVWTPTNELRRGNLQNVDIFGQMVAERGILFICTQSDKTEGTRSCCACKCHFLITINVTMSFRCHSDDITNILIEGRYCD